jgi:hypothetical protein
VAVHTARLLSVLPCSRFPKAGKTWLKAGRLEEAEWPLQQLRERLSALEALSGDACADSDARCAAQLLQFHTLQGSMVLAAHAGHQVHAVPGAHKVLMPHL